MENPLFYKKILPALLWFFKILSLRINKGGVHTALVTHIPQSVWTFKIGRNELKHIWDQQTSQSWSRRRHEFKLLGIEIDDKLNFNHHINNICKSASNQLNALTRLKHLLGFKERKVLVNTFVMSNFNYCSLVWNFYSAQSLNIIENVQKELYASCWTIMTALVKICYKNLAIQIWI